MSVDEGLDVTATKGEKLFNIQAKTFNEKQIQQTRFQHKHKLFREIPIK